LANNQVTNWQVYLPATGLFAWEGGVKAGAFICVGWQVTLWQVTLRSSVMSFPKRAIRHL